MISKHIKNKAWTFFLMILISFGAFAQNSMNISDNSIKILECIEEAIVPADFLVDFSALSYLGNWQFIAYYNKSRNLTINSREITNKHWMKLPSKAQPDNEFYVLRWEKMGKCRFYDPPEKPAEPSVLKVYKFIN